jgi:hypothetical protein
MKRSFLSVVLFAGLIALASGAEAQDGGSLFVIHGIPDLPAEVDVYANGGYVATFDFGESLGPLNLPAGDYYLEAKLLDLPVLTASATIMDGGDYTAVAHLTEMGGYKLSLYENDNSAIRDTRTRLTVRHNAEAPTVDLRLSRSKNLNERFAVSGLSNSDQTGPIDIVWGPYTADLYVGDSMVFSSGQVDLMDKNAYIVYAIGSFPETFQFFYQVITP